MEEVHAVLLAGGKASRMSPLSQYIPKCLLPLRDRPLIIRYLEKLEQLGVKRVTIVLEPFLGSMIELAITRGYKGKIWIKFLYQDRTQGRGPGYALLLCKDYVTSPLLVFLPDEWRQGERFSYSVVHEPERYRVINEWGYNSYSSCCAAVGVASFNNEELTAIGNVAIDQKTGLITKYVNKPNPKDIVSKWGTSGGWAFFDTNLLFEHLERLKENPKYINSELHMAVLLQAMINDNLKVYAFKEEVGRHYHFTNISAFWEAQKYGTD